MFFMGITAALVSGGAARADELPGQSLQRICAK